MRIGLPTIVWALPAVLWCGLAGPSAQAGGCTMSRVSQLPLQPSHGHVLVDAALNGRPAKLIFDTGAFTSLLTEAAVDRLGLTHLQGEDIRNALGGVSGIGGDRTARFVTAHRVEFGGLHARDYNFMAAGLPMSWADGLVSIDLISQFDVDLDFPEMQIVLYRPTGDCSAPAAFLAGPLYDVPLEPVGQDRRPRMRVDVNGHSLIALLDTGAPLSAISRTAAAQLGLRLPKRDETSKSMAGGVGPERVTSDRQVIEEFSIGDLTFRNMPIRVLDGSLGDGVVVLLGADFQSMVHIWISYSSHTLIMQYPPLPSKKVSGR